MIDVHVVCTYDARKLAETLIRLLEAEGHRARLTFGRQSLAQLEAAKSDDDAVLLIWSPDAPSQLYMLEWARNIDPVRLVEIALAPGAPRIVRKAPVIDFAAWRGERGARAWNALTDRLRAIARDLDPRSAIPPQRAAMALGLASLAAVGGAMWVRFDQAAPTQQQQAAAPVETISTEDMDVAMGGPLDAIEPMSAEDLDALHRLPNPRFTPMETPTLELHPVGDTVPDAIRDATLLERISALNPLRRDGQNE
jgi:hypothetical protein